MRQVTIVGGGLAGLTLGIALRQEGVPVRVFEAASYPRHRVCGEFISGTGLEMLRRLGLWDEIVTRAQWARTVSFHLQGSTRVLSGSLPEPGLAIGRYELDAFLADKFRGLGGELRTDFRFDGPLDQEGVVRATGRKLQPRGGKRPLLGLKAHLKGVLLQSDLEMHCWGGGYLGLCRLPGGEVNACALIQDHLPAGDLKSSWLRMIQDQGAGTARQALAEAKPVEGTFCSVAGFTLERFSGKADDCAIGDAFTMTPPVTGNGMSMAFESAETAAAPLVGYAQGKIRWSACKEAIQQGMVSRFGSRLRWAARLNRLIFTGARHPLLFDLVARGLALNWFFKRTRS
jgi:2-polyprenyl-6-methoxyphenol hydroxylase-like FAD-dependent oxidoreductase